MNLAPTARQRQAIEAPLGPVLVVAGPGAGKTFCLIERIRYLIAELGLAPERICAVTFTNKAAEEIAHRLELALGDRAHQITRGTLHALCVALLRRHGAVLPVRPGFGIADEEYQRLVLRRLGVEERRWGQLLGLFGRYRLQGYPLTAGDEALFRRYRAWLQKRELLDFDELILRTADLLQAHPGVAAEIGAAWDYVLVDEFQDLSPRQYDIIQGLAARHRNVFAVGDDEQSIYAWAGADPEVLRRFARDFGIAAPIVLDENHRTPSEIFGLARRLLGANPPLFAKDIRARRSSGHAVQVRGFPDEGEEMRWLLADLAADRAASGLDWGEYALLYRRHEIGNALEGALVSAGIPCRLARGRAILDDPVVRFLAAALQLIQSPGDPLAVERLAELVLGRELVGRIRATRRPEEEFAAALSRYARGLPRAAPERKQVWRTVYTMENLAGLAARHEDLTSLVEELLSRRVGPYRTPLEDRQEELSDPLDLPAARALAAGLGGAMHGRRRVWLPSLGGVEIALRGMLLGAGITTADYLGRPGASGPEMPRADDLILGNPPGGGEGGLPLSLLVFKALQLVHSGQTDQGLRAFVAFDLETTGLEVERCEIVELAAVRVRDGAIREEFHSLVWPRVPVHPEATQRHGYAEADLAGQPRFEEIWPRFRAFVGDEVLVAHNGHEFDVPVLFRMAAGLGGVDGLRFFDTLPLARALEPGSARLEALAERFGVPQPRPHHALDDARALVGVYLALERRRAIVGRKTCLANLLDYLALGLALEGAGRLDGEAATVFGAARGYALGRYSDCLSYYEQERAFAPGPAPDLAEVIERLGGQALLERIRAERRAADRYPSTLARLQPFLRASRAPTLGESIRRFLDRLALTTSEGVEAAPHRVNLLTRRSTKGLEFSRVYIVGVEDRQLPGKRALEEKRTGEIEEARRLLYVGMTRARDRLVLTHVEERNGWRWGGRSFWRKWGSGRERAGRAGQPSALGAGRRQERQGRLGPALLPLVLEEHVDLVPRLGPDPLGPGAKGRGRIACPVEPHVAPGCGGDQRGLQLFPFRHTQRGAGLAEHLPGGVAEPGGVPELERRSPAPGQELEESLEPGHVLFQVRRELKQGRSQPLSQRRGDPQEIPERLLGSLKPVVVGDALGRLQREPELRRDLAGPGQQDALARHPIERVVDLHRGQSLRVGAEHPVVREARRIEASFPFLEGVAAGAGQNAPGLLPPIRHARPPFLALPPPRSPGRGCYTCARRSAAMSRPSLPAPRAPGSPSRRSTSRADSGGAK